MSEKPFSDPSQYGRTVSGLKTRRSNLRVTPDHLFKADRSNYIGDLTEALRCIEHLEYIIKESERHDDSDCL